MEMNPLEFGEPATNIAAGKNNPMRHAYFVEYKTKSHTNKYGITHSEHLIRITDRNKKFWDVDAKVIYPGHLSEEESHKLFTPIWEAEYSN